MSGVNIQFIFNPQNCSLKQLDATLTRNRRDLANLILDHIKDSIETGGSYNDLIIGPRGTGKTHLLHYIRRTLTELKYPPGGPLNVIHLTEEERGITTLLHFLLLCLRAAGIPSGTLIDLFSKEDPVLSTQKVVDFFRDVTNRKPTLLIIENLSDIFFSLNDKGIADLRGFLQNNPYISLLASSVFLFKKSSKPDHPFYGYFDIHALDYLKAEDSHDFLSILAKVNGQTDLYTELKKKKSRRRINAIQVLTGGNHRLLSMLSFFLNPQSFDDLVLPFQQMADRELTPYYQQRLNCLSAQQNRILEAIAEHHGKAINVKEIAQYAFLDQNAVSRQLCDLLSAGFVQRDQKGRESYYELREPLLRLVLDMKEGRDKPLSTIVQLLRAWYEAEELEKLAPMTPAITQIYYQYALVEEKTKAKEAFQGIYKTEDLQPQKQPVSDFSVKRIKEIRELLKAGKHEQALERINKDILAEPDNIKLLLIKGSLLGDLGRNEEAIAVYDDVVVRFGKKVHSNLKNVILYALNNKSILLASSRRYEESLDVCEKALRIDQQNIIAIHNKILNLFDLHRDEEGLQAIKHFIVNLQPNEEENSILIFQLLNRSITNASLLKKIISLFIHEEKSLIAGLSLWLRDQLSHPKLIVKDMEDAERNLKEVFGGIPAGHQIITILNAVNRYTSGDTKALLDIPLELRSLVLPLT